MFALLSLGKETTKVLLQHNAKVYIACRSADKAKAAIEDLKALTGNSNVHILIMDLANLPTIKTGVADFLKWVTLDPILAIADQKRNEERSTD